MVSPREQLLAEVEDIIETMPPRATIRHDTAENHNWFGRASAIIEKWNPRKVSLAKEYLDLFFSNGHARETAHGLTKLLTLLNQAQAELRLEVASVTNTNTSDTVKTRAPSDAAVVLTDNRQSGTSRSAIRIFVSHSHADAAIAEAFADLFQSAFSLPCNTIRCSSVPRYSLQFGVEVPRQIRDEVLCASVVIGIVTENSRESAWVLFELGARWGASGSLIPVLAPAGEAELLPPPIRNANAVICSYENVIKLAEEVATLLGESIPRASTYTKQVDAVLKAVQMRESSSPKPESNQLALQLLDETRFLKNILREIRRRWPDSNVLKAPLNRFLWGAEIGQKQIDADVQEGMRFHDRMWEFAATLHKEFPGGFDLSAVMQDQFQRQMYGLDRVLDLLDAYGDRFQDMYIGKSAR